MRTSLAVVALSALTAVSAQRKVFTAADINVATVSVNQRGKSIGRNDAIICGNQALPPNYNH